MRNGPKSQPKQLAPPIWEQAAAFVEQNLDVAVEYIRRDTWNVEVPDIEDHVKLKNCYRNDPRIKSFSANIFYSELQLLEWVKCSKDPVYFLTKYVKIVSLDYGIVPFKLWDYQKDIIKTYVQERFVISMQSRQSGKSTTAAGYILFYSLFQQDRTTAILANKAAQAQEIVRRIQGMYESIPWFLQPGVTSYNKRSMGLANRSQVISAASSNSSIRGQSINLLYLDEFAFIPREQEFYESTYPVITSGIDTKVLITSTPKGARGLFFNLWQGAIKGNNEYVHKLVTWRDIPGRDEKWAKTTRANMTEAQWNQEMECQFLGSQNTLIPYSILSTIFTEEPLDGITDNEHLDVYDEPVKGRKYFMTVDTSRGFGQDYSAFIVYDITEIPFKTVAKYRNNRISTMLFPTVVFNTALHYNEAEVLVEVNDAGIEVVNKLYYDFEYENTLMTSKDGAKVILGGYGTNAILGLRTTKSTKAIGCGNLKVMVEKEKLRVTDFDTIDELTNFVEKGSSYEADEGCHDDLVMCLVLFAWASSQDHFKQNYDVDIRKRFEEEEMLREEASLMPFGVISSNAYDDDVPATIEDYAEIRWASERDPTF